MTRHDFKPKSHASPRAALIHIIVVLTALTDRVCNMVSLRVLLPILCLLGLSCTAYAQNLTASTPAANLTVIAQNAQNFTNMTLPTFPCDGTPGLVGGYSTLDLDDAQNDEDLYYIVNEVFNYFYTSTINLTDCTYIEVDYSNLTNACSQVTTIDVLCLLGSCRQLVAAKL